MIANHELNCGHCEVKVKSKSQLEDHIKENHVILCNIFDTRVLTSKTDLENHMKACHSFDCEICDKVFPTNSELADHN